MTGCTTTSEAAAQHHRPCISVVHAVATAETHHLACRRPALTPSNSVACRRAVATFGSVFLLSPGQRHRPGPSVGLGHERPGRRAGGGGARLCPRHVSNAKASKGDVCTLYPRPRLGRSTRVVHLKRPQNVRFSISETRDRAAAVRLEYRNGTMLKNIEHGDHLGPCYCRISERSRPRAQTGESPSSRFQ